MLTRAVCYVAMCWAAYICLDAAILFQKGQLAANDIFVFSLTTPLLVGAPIVFSKSL